MKVEVRYDVPVSAWVDLDSGKIERVQVWCEGIEQRDGECAIVSAAEERPVDDDLRDRTQAIVDSKVWPAWDFA